jgi:hypothetical protein
MGRGNKKVRLEQEVAGLDKGGGNPMQRILSH